MNSIDMRLLRLRQIREAQYPGLRWEFRSLLPPLRRPIPEPVVDDGGGWNREGFCRVSRWFWDENGFPTRLAGDF